MGVDTMVLVEQTAAVDMTRVGERVGRLTLADMQRIEKALLRVFGMD
jgi:mRNA-degrading endonuclease toxin of MazEF toxin-antitoxin module